jgi:Family of unknown function (DUF6660)
MKVVAFILSAYLLFLFAIPCCAFDNCPEDKTAQEANHEKGDGDCGSCSPFFTCTGCSGFTVSFDNNCVEIVPPFTSHQYAGFILSSIPDVHYDFWQPPKLV